MLYAPTRLSPIATQNSKLTWASSTSSLQQLSSNQNNSDSESADQHANFQSLLLFDPPSDDLALRVADFKLEQKTISTKSERRSTVKSVESHHVPSILFSESRCPTYFNNNDNGEDNVMGIGKEQSYKILGKKQIANNSHQFIVAPSITKPSSPQQWAQPNQVADDNTNCFIRVVSNRKNGRQLRRGGSKAVAVRSPSHYCLTSSKHDKENCQNSADAASTRGSVAQHPQASSSSASQSNSKQKFSLSDSLKQVVQQNRVLADPRAVGQKETRPATRTATSYVDILAAFQNIWASSCQSPANSKSSERSYLDSIALKQMISGKSSEASLIEGRIDLKRVCSLSETATTTKMIPAQITQLKKNQSVMVNNKDSKQENPEDLPMSSTVTELQKRLGNVGELKKMLREHSSSLSTSVCSSSFEEQSTTSSGGIQLSSCHAITTVMSQDCSSSSSRSSQAAGPEEPKLATATRKFSIMRCLADQRSTADFQSRLQLKHDLYNQQEQSPVSAIATASSSHSGTTISGQQQQQTSSSYLENLATHIAYSYQACLLQTTTCD